MKLNNKYVFAIFIKFCLLILNIIESILVVRYLGTYLKGEVSYINNISQLLFLFCTLGIDATYPYFKRKKGKEDILNTIMSLTIILTFLYSLISIFLIFFIKNVEIRYILFLLPILCYNHIVIYIYTVDNPNKKNIIVLFLTILKILYLIFLSLFINVSLFFGITIIVLIPLIENIIFTKEIKFKFSFYYIKLNNLLNLIRISYLTLICNLLTVANYKIDIIMLKQFDYISLSEIGIYSVGIALTEKIFILGDSVKEVLISDLSNGKSIYKVAQVSRITFAISFFIAIIFSFFSSIIINLLYGKDYLGASIIIDISIWGAVFMIFFKLISQYNIILAKQKVNCIILSITLFINVILNFIFISRLGIRGVAFSTSISYLLCAVLFILYFHKQTKIKLRDIVLIKKEDIKVLSLIFRRFV